MQGSACMCSVGICVCVCVQKEMARARARCRATPRHARARHFIIAFFRRHHPPASATPRTPPRHATPRSARAMRARSASPSRRHYAVTLSIYARAPPRQKESSRKSYSARAAIMARTRDSAPPPSARAKERAHATRHAAPRAATTARVTRHARCARDYPMSRALYN